MSAMHLNAMLHFFLLLIDEKGAERVATGTQHTSVVNAATDIERQSGRTCMRAVYTCEYVGVHDPNAGILEMCGE